MLSMIRCIEIEIHSYCNRVCTWCPNYEFERDKIHILPEKTYKEILNELKDNNFNGVISYSRYNEPMSLMPLLKKRIQQAKRVLPITKLVSNTNGDFLIENNLKGLLLDELTVMDYDCLGLKRCINRMESVNAKICKVEYPYIYAIYNKMKILYYVDWPLNTILVDRGGFLKDNVLFKNKKIVNNNSCRKRACLEPKYFVGIDYTGNVVPCCEIRGDNPRHKVYILGNVQKSSLCEIYYSRKAVSLRKILMNDKKYESYILPCRNCQKDPGRYTREIPGIEYC